MSKKTMFLVMCPLVMLGTTAAQAVTVDLSSPQEGGVVGPGDTISVTVTVTNDSAKRDLIRLTANIDAAGIPVPISVRVKSKLNLKAGQVWTQTVTATIPSLDGIPPEYIPTEPVPVTLTVAATGKKSGTQDEDSLMVTFDPDAGP
jgi:hypothetical protein